MTDPAQVIRECPKCGTKMLPGMSLAEYKKVRSEILEAKLEDARDRVSELTVERNDLDAKWRHMSQRYEDVYVEHERTKAERDRVTRELDGWREGAGVAVAEIDRLREALREVGFVTIHCTHGAKVRRILERAALSQSPQEEA